MKIQTFIVSIAALAASPAAADDTQLWSALFANGPAADNGRLLLWFDGHARFRDDVERLGVSIIRPGIGWRLGDSGAAVWAGYARVVSRSASAPNIEENRFWQQATYRFGEIAGVQFSGRTRLEQRLLNSGDDTGWRVRQFIRAERIIGTSAWSAVGWNETFVALNDTDWGAISGYDQNRLFVGGAWRPGDRWRIEAGYLNNHIRRENAPDPVNHAVSVALFFNL